MNIIEKNVYYKTDFALYVTPVIVKVNASLFVVFHYIVNVAYKLIFC